MTGNVQTRIPRISARQRWAPRVRPVPKPVLPWLLTPAFLALALLALVFLALVVLTVGSVPAAAQDAEMSDEMSPAAPEEPVGYVGRELCAACHDEGETFLTGAHGRAMAARGEDLLERSCETCHGPGEAHAEDPTPENIVRWAGDDACVTCHTASSGRLALANPAHERHDLACADCHDEGHVENAERVVAEALLKTRPFELCGDCHKLQASSFFRPFAHREGAEPFDCTACHSAHGTGRVGRLASFTRTGVCADCHEEKVGPFVFPHPPQALDGCLACHEPHGSTNPRLLTRRTVLSLCLECHADVPAFHDVTQPRFRNCQTCHSAVHGSNRDGRLFDE